MFEKYEVVDVVVGEYLWIEVEIANGTYGGRSKRPLREEKN